MQSLLHKIYLSPFEIELKTLLDKDSIDFSKMNFTFQSIIVNLIRVKSMGFPENLGLLFLIENYIGFFLLRKRIEGLSKEGKHNKAYKLRIKESSDPLGVLFSSAKKYLSGYDLVNGLKSIIDDRNILTHKLLFSSKDDKDIEKVANKLIQSIYSKFEKLQAKLTP